MNVLVGLLAMLLDEADRLVGQPADEQLRLYRLVDGQSETQVAEMTDGRVGYLHIPDMGHDGIAEFIKRYYPQIRKEGLVVDVRSNGGGNVSAMIIERLRREVLGTRFGRVPEVPGTYPRQTFHGHLACLLNEDSASDGDIFPHMFRQAGLGPLIGKRSWGGVIGITSHGPLIDGGSVHHLPARTREVFDVSGAGDTVVAIVAAFLMKNSDRRQS